MKRVTLRNTIVALVLLFLMIAPMRIIFSQAKTDSRPSFEVATIKLNRTMGGIGNPYAVNGDRFTASGLTLKSLIGYAYRVKEVQGGPGWVRSDYWDIEAKAHEKIVTRKLTFNDRDDVPDMAALMLQSLLEDRFKLRIRQQQKEYPVYKVVVAKGGLKIQPSADQSPPSPIRPKTIGKLQRGSVRKTLNSFEGSAISIATFVNLLQGNSDCPLINQTNLSGLYDIKLKWSREEASSGTNNESASPLAGVDLFFGPSFFRAIQEQLGLKLEPAKAPFDFIVIENVQKPSVN
jgi:uncharacterized protein (TIGR03435 family)